MACFLAPTTLAVITTGIRKRFSEKYHISWLLTMLWGGVIMLIVEHIAHREVVPYPPFFTAGIKEMLPEILKVGVPMTLAIVVVWGVMVLISNKITRLSEKKFGDVKT